MPDFERMKMLRERESAANEAKMLLEHPVLVEAFNGLEALYTKMWAQSDADNPAAREKFYFAINALRDLRAKLASTARDGVIVRTELLETEQQEARDLLQ